MKKSPLVMSIISAVLSAAAVALLFFLPKLSPELATLLGTNYLHGIKTNLFAAFKGTIGFGIGNAVFSGILVALVAIVLIFWLWHFIMLYATRRANSLSINLFWLIFGACSTFVVLCFIGYTKAGVGYVFEGEFAGVAYHNGISLISVLFKDGFVKHAAAICLLAGILALAIVSLVLGLISVIGAIHDDRTNPHEIEENITLLPDEEKETNEKEDKNPQDAIVTEQNSDNKKGEKEQPSSPLIVQNITYAPTPNVANPLQTSAPAPVVAPVKEEKKDTPLTEEGLKNILLEILNEKKEKEPVQVQEAPAPAVKEEKPVEERPLTAKELRSIIKNELRDHDHPEELLPLTDEQCRSLIREELNQYYASTRPVSEKKEEVKEEQKEAAPVSVSTPKEEMEEDFMTAEELSKMIRNEVIQVVDEQPKQEPLTIDTVKDAIHEALASYQPKVETLKKEDVQNIVKEELASTIVDTQKQNEAIASSREQALQAEYEAKLVAAKNENAIERLRASQLSADDIRSIISEELDKKLANLEKKKEPVVETPKEEPLQLEKKEETVAVETLSPASEEEEERRIPFATRLLSLDDDIKEYYNLLKEEALSYGLKSRLSISGDTFRLHTKTYLKIVVAGKGLKLYMALDPSAYKDSSIPVKDAGTKNLYKDIPLVFKVKSPLSLRRAKSLIKDVCEKDGLKQSEITTFDYVAQLSSYRVAGTEEEE